MNVVTVFNACQTGELAALIMEKMSREDHDHDEGSKVSIGFAVLGKEAKHLLGTHNMKIYGTISAWLNASLLLRLLDFHFDKRGRIDVPFVLRLDDFGRHKTRKV
ncbi:hypothetical protein PybrP1_011798 [[Pythium] brassicae (nom. inval.)]|nr:hypothetical protein PybrP1_011798 [[Pythium] brassicae (nom. inval.)]